MRGLLIKIGLLLCVWYEVTAELGLTPGMALLVTLLICGAALMLLRLPAQLLSLAGPRAIVALGPLLVWGALAWWLWPGVVTAYPALAVLTAVILALLGAGSHYVVSRYPERFAKRVPLLRGTIIPMACVGLALAAQWPWTFLPALVAIVVIGLPLRLGWRFIGPVSPDRFDAKMGDAGSFRRSGFSKDV